VHPAIIKAFSLPTVAQENSLVQQFVIKNVDALNSLQIFKNLMLVTYFN